MAVLDQLTLSSAAPKRDTSPAGRFRRRFIDAIDLQIALAEAQASGTAFQRTRTRRIKNDAGLKEPREVPLRVQQWWWKDDAGTTFLSPRMGQRLLEIVPGKSTIEVGAFTDLPAKLAILRDAVRAGELDGCMVAGPPRRAKKAEKGGGEGAKKPPRRPVDGARQGAAEEGPTFASAAPLALR